MTPEELKEDDFIATVKLVSGEEIVARVCYLPDEDKVILENPLQVELAVQDFWQVSKSEPVIALILSPTAQS